jgi:RecB family exonuclease
VWPEPYTREQAARRAVQALEQAAAAGRPAVATPCASDVRLAVLRAVAETARHAEPGPWAGLIRDPAVLAVLDRRFGPDRVWSASQLELWARNPFVFLVQRVLHLDEQAEADEDASPLVQGGVAHRLLERFFSAVRTDLPAPFAGLAGRYHAVADAVFADLERDRTWLGLPQLWRIRREALRRMVAEYLTWDLDRLEAWRPRHLEYAFGTGDLPPVTIRGRDRHGAEVALLIRGSVDRVDHDGSVCRVIDYKTGPVPSPRGYRDGAVLQAPLYLAALAAQGLPVASAEYRALRARKAGARVVWGDEACQAALTLALSIPALVRAGRFEPSAAASVGWQGYWPGGLALYRAQAAVEGSRFDD